MDINNIRRANSSLSILPNHYRNRQNSMPPPMWKNSQGHIHQQQTQPNEIFNAAGNGRQRASTMTDKLLTLSAASAQETQDYFTYLSAHNQHQFINIQSSSPPQLSVQTPEMTIPEIRLAPPNNSENRIPSPEYIDIRNNQFWPTSPVVGRSRGQSTHSLAPPSILSDVDDSAFYSCRQSFEISPSDSFDHQNQLLSAIMNIPRHQEENEDQGHSSVFQDVLQLNIPNNEGGVSSLLYPTNNNNPSLYHYRENSDYSFHLKCCRHGPSTRYSKWYLILEELTQVMLPTLQGWKEKSFFSKLSSLAAAPLVLIFTVTLPVAEIEQVKVDDIEVIETLVNEDEGISTNKSKDAKNYLSVPVAENDVLTETKVIIDDVDTRQGWNKYLMVLQSVISTTFLFGVFAGKKKSFWRLYNFFFGITYETISERCDSRCNGYCRYGYWVIISNFCYQNYKGR
ncbi:hypothetical protein HPULCUR_005823 [Helicostylum pulchrum]|uniref:Uncharacterized protein n=1 Tax=Helicostylum pulchrum TaxID=562976 RepID=A0ABP9Y063_9FUNG